MDANWLILLLPLAATSGWWFANRQNASDEKSILDFNQSCLLNINQLLTIEDDEALKSFLATMAQQPKSVELQMVLGSLCRRKGEYERASLIHQTIINNESHGAAIREQAQFELAQDYQAAGWLDRSESLYVALLNSAAFQVESANNLLKIYQQEKDWENAIGMNRFLCELGHGNDKLSVQLAHFYCELCEICIHQGKFLKAQAHLDSAIETYANDPRVIIMRGRIAVFKGDSTAAQQAWETLAQTAPSFLGVAIKHIQDSYLLSNDKIAYLAFLKRAANRSQDPIILAALLENLKAEGSQSTGQFFLQYLKNRPSIEGVKQVLLNWQQISKQIPDAFSGQSSNQITNDDLLFLVETMAKMLQTEENYQCSECGFKAQKFEWSCPGCQHWGAYQRIVRPELQAELQIDQAILPKDAGGQGLAADNGFEKGENLR